MRRLTAILLALLSFCGCLSKGDAAHHIYVLSFGVESGDTFAYRIVLLAAMPKAGSEEGATLSTEVLAAEARTLFEAIETLNEVKESIINAYAAKSGLRRGKIAELMSNETWMNAKKAVELGFADEVLFEGGEPEPKGEEAGTEAPAAVKAEKCIRAG